MAKDSVSSILENADFARQCALNGSYDDAGIFYEAVLQSIQKHISTIGDNPMRRGQWNMVRILNIFPIVNHTHRLNKTFSDSTENPKRISAAQVNSDIIT